MTGWKPYRFRGMDCMLFEGRPKEFPEGFWFYPLRHDETDWAQPMTIEPTVVVNYWGVIGLPRPLDFLIEDWILLTPEEGEEIANLFA